MYYTVRVKRNTTRVENWIKNVSANFVIWRRDFIFRNQCPLTCDTEKLMMFISLSLSLSIYIYIYMYFGIYQSTYFMILIHIYVIICLSVCLSTYIYIYIYIYIYQREHTLQNSKTSSNGSSLVHTFDNCR